MSKNFKILIIRLGAIGDVVVTSGLFRALKNLNPNISVHYLTSDLAYELLEHDPDLDKVWFFKDKAYKEIFKLTDEMKKEKFDLVLTLQTSIRIRILTFLCKAKKVLYYKKNFKLHVVDNFCETAKRIFKDLSPVPCLNLYIEEEIKEKIKKQMPSKTAVCFNIGANPGREGRKWPFEYWVKLAELIKEKYNVDIVLSGGKEDIEKTEEFLKLVPNVTSFAGKLSIKETAAMLSLCKLVISGDTGPLHIATASGAKCIGIYGCTGINRTGPYGNHQAIQSPVKCSPCEAKKCKFKKSKDDEPPCMLEILPKDIIDLVDIALT